LEITKLWLVRRIYINLGYHEVGKKMRNKLGLSNYSLRILIVFIVDFLDMFDHLSYSKIFL
jgi:hypothetical protein